MKLNLSCKIFLEIQKNAVYLQSNNAEIAQLVERDLAKVEVAGPNPVFRSKRLKIKQLSLPKQKFGRLFCCDPPGPEVNALFE